MSLDQLEAWIKGHATLSAEMCDTLLSVVKEVRDCHADLKEIVNTADLGRSSAYADDFLDDARDVALVGLERGKRQFSAT